MGKMAVFLDCQLNAVKNYTFYTCLFLYNDGFFMYKKSQKQHGI